MIGSGGAMAAGWTQQAPVSTDWAVVSMELADVSALAAEAAEEAEARGQTAAIDAEEPDDTPSAEETGADAFCSPEVLDALAAGDDSAVIAAVGGAEAFRAAVADQRASDCIALDDPTHAWVVVNKRRPLDPIDFTPNTARPQTTSLVGGHLSADVVESFDAMVQAARDAGVGEIALESGFRSYDTQISSYQAQVSIRGQEGADLTSARPGHSEHQTGLAADLVSCSAAGSCGTIYDFGATEQGRWIAENAWRHGWIIRYQEGATHITGYDPEPWHLRYIGVPLAEAYTEGGYDTFEEFFGLEAAPDYG